MKNTNAIAGVFIGLFILVAPQARSAEFEECKFEMPANGDVKGGKATLDRLKADCVPKIQRAHTCALRGRLLLENVDELTARFITGDKSKPLMIDAALKGSFDPKAVNMGLWANFASLESDYHKALDVINSFVIKYKDKPNDKSKLVEYLAEVDRGFNLNSANLADLSIRESALLSFIDQASRSFEESSVKAKPEVQWLISDACKDYELKPILLQTEVALTVIGQKIDSMRRLILSAKQARETLIVYSYEAIRNDLASRYRDKAIEELSTLNTKIDTILQANRIMEEFEMWSLNQVSDIEKSSVETYWLQFEASRRINAIDYITTKDFLQRMQIVTENQPETGAIYIPRLTETVKFYDQKVSRVEEMGWNGFFSRQKLLANKRLENPEKYPAKCVENLRAYITASNQVTTIEQYRIVEPMYKAAMLVCGAKK